MDVIRNLSNLPGWRTNRRFLIVESDDWGAIRTPSKETLDQLNKDGIYPANDDEARYFNNDTLASSEDFEALYEVLRACRDKEGNPAVFTGVTVPANPDFPKIKESDYSTYFYEPFTETLSRYGKSHERSFEYWKLGIQEKLFIPQFHGREHLNVSAWMSALKGGNRDTLVAFKHQVYGMTPKNPVNYIYYQAAFNVFDPQEINYQRNVIDEGLQLFEKIHGYKATFFVPPNGWFNNVLEENLARQGVRYIGASKIQKEPQGFGKVKKRFHYLGQKNKFNQLYTIRNCFFEPNSNQKTDWVDACLSEIEIAFRWKKPAVISSHRCNYIGSIHESNRKHGLAELKRLLQAVLKRWPDTEFISSDQLGDLISKK